MNSSQQAPARLASEDVIINAPMSYAGSSQRIMRLRRRADAGWKLTALTALAVVLVLLVWTLVTVWYLVWGFWLVPYRLLRRGARKRRAEALRHRELLGTIQGSAVASANAIVASQIARPVVLSSPNELVADADRERAIAELREHMLAGRLTTEEFEERLAAAQTARTQADIAAVRMYLPLQPAHPAADIHPAADTQ